MNGRTNRAVAAVSIIVLLSTSFGASANHQEAFQDGCCVESSTFPRETDVSRATVPHRILLRALNCATNNKYLHDTKNIARDVGDVNSFSVAYHYGRYLGQEGPEVLTIAVYSPDKRTGWLFDVTWEGDRYFINNLPPLLRGRNQWRVGEINGGVWSYTRLWYLAQEIGSRPRQSIRVSSVLRSKPSGCDVF